MKEAHNAMRAEGAEDEGVSVCVCHWCCLTLRIRSQRG